MITKKRVLTLLLAAAMVFLVACGGQKETTIYEYKDSETGDHITHTYTHVGDDILVQEVLDKAEYSQFSGMDRDYIKDILEEAKKRIDAVDGMSYDLDYHDDYVLIKLTIDYENLDYDKAMEFQDLGLTEAHKERVSLKMTEEQLEQMGYTKVK